MTNAMIIDAKDNVAVAIEPKSAVQLQNALMQHGCTSFPIQIQNFI